MSDKKFKIGIVGAGIQGVCNALFLQKKGYQVILFDSCLLYTSPSPRDMTGSRMPSSA